MSPVTRRPPRADAEAHDLGLSHDLPKLLSRRRALGMLGGAGLLALAGCAEDTADATASSPATTSTGSAGEEIPEETGGPYPADGSNGVNVLTESGIVRSDSTSSFGTASATATGVPLTIALKVLDVSGGGGALTGAAVYLWHCDREGRYSMYDEVYATSGYERSVANLAKTSLDSDMVFGDGYSLQLASVTGDVTRGMTASLGVPV